MFGTLQPQSEDPELTKLLFQIQNLAEQYNAIYSNPKHYKAKVVTVVRTEPNRTSEILGYTTIDTIYEVTDCTTACDWDWAKINFNGQTGWTAMGDILGNQYGERLK